MKFLKFIVLSAAMATMAMASTSSFAASKEAQKVIEAAEGTIAKVEETLSLIEKGADKAAILAPLGEARQLQKEFRYEQTERERQYANNQLKAARAALDEGDNKKAEAAVRDALKILKEMKATYDAAH
ncbi:MAG: hypothetical protein ABL919_14270 [Methylococcales bacterium]|nr:hypothetical protein [Methylococcaceae bacterium]